MKGFFMNTFTKFLAFVLFFSIASQQASEMSIPSPVPQKPAGLTPTGLRIYASIDNDFEKMAHCIAGCDRLWRRGPDGQPGPCAQRCEEPIKTQFCRQQHDGNGDDLFKKEDLGFVPCRIFPNKQKLECDEYAEAYRAIILGLPQYKEKQRAREYDALRKQLAAEIAAAEAAENRATN
jgi:hypothetical protein